MKELGRISKTKFLNRFGLSAAALSLVIAPTMIAASCGSSSSSIEEPKTPAKVETSNVIKAPTWNPGKAASEVWGVDSVVKGNRNLDMITDSISQVIENWAGKNRFLTNQTDPVADRYSYAQKQGGRLIVAWGADQAQEISNKVNSKEIGAFSDTRWILLDGAVSSGYVASVTFHVEQAAFLAGFLSAHKARELDGENPVVSTFGNQNTPSITAYMAGFQQGVKKYNEMLHVKDASAKKVSFYVPSPVFFGTSPASLNSLESYVKTLFNDKSVDILMPVVGFQVETILSYFTKYPEWQGKKMIVGVDHDLSRLYKSDSVEYKAIYTSVIKDIVTTLNVMLNSIYYYSNPDLNKYVSAPGESGISDGPYIKLDKIKSLSSKFTDQKNSFFGREVEVGSDGGFVEITGWYGAGKISEPIRTLFTHDEINEVLTNPVNLALISPVFDEKLAV